MTRDEVREKIISVITRGYTHPEYREWGEEAAAQILAIEGLAVVDRNGELTDVTVTCAKCGHFTTVGLNPPIGILKEVTDG